MQKAIGKIWTKLLGWVVVSICCLIVAADIFVEPKQLDVPVKAGSIKQWDGKAYGLAFELSSPWSYLVIGDSNNKPRVSRLEVTVDSHKLSKPHAVHADIVALGGGRYSHWEESLIFSMPDGVEAPKNIENSISLKTWVELPSRIVTPAQVVVTIFVLFLVRIFLLRSQRLGLTAAIVDRMLILFPSLCLLLAYLTGWFGNVNSLVVWPDSIGYIIPALSDLNGEDLRLVMGRTFGYPLILSLVLELGSFNFVPLVQLGLFLLTLVALSLAWLLIACKVGLGGRMSSAILLGVLLVPLSYYPMTFYTFAVMPETLYQFLSVVSLLGGMSLLYLRMPRVYHLLVSLLVLLISSFAVYVKPHWLGAMLFTWMLVVFSYWLRRDIRLPIAVGSILICAIFSLFIVHKPNAVLADKYDQAGASFGAKTLFCNHIELIDPILDQYLDDSDLVALVRSEFEKVYSMPVSGWKIHGYSGDHCLYTLKIPGLITHKLQLDYDQQKNLFIELFVGGVKENIWRYVKKVFKQYYAVLAKPYTQRNQSVHPASNYSVYLELIDREDFKRADVEAEFSHEDIKHPLSGGFFEVPDIGRYILKKLNKMSFFLFVSVFVVFFIDVIVSIKKKEIFSSIVDRWSVVIVTLGFYLSSLSVVAAAHTFDILRYAQFSSLLGLLYQAAAICVIAKVVWGWFADNKKIACDFFYRLKGGKLFGRT